VKTPYKVLFSNDTTNILTCNSPYHPWQTRVTDKETGRERRTSPPFSEAMLEATVDETAGVGIDVHLLQPGVGWVPWWKSKAYPFEEHIKFMKEQTGMDPSNGGFDHYMAQGGDMVEVFCRRCRKKGLAPFVSFRLNDVHGHEFIETPREKIPASAWHTFSPVHVNHPDWRLGDIHDWSGKALDWGIPEVRQSKFAFIKEIIEQYDIDGFELDFMRHCNFFRQEKTTVDERREIMNGFVRNVRAELGKRDRADGRHRWLCVRIPAQAACFDSLGIDPGGMVEAGVEMFNLSNYYYTEHRGDFARFRELVGDDVSVYFEMCHTVQQRHVPDSFNAYDRHIQRRTTPLQYYTGAHLAYRRGCDGCSTFNFVYYREHGVGDRGPATEPPFEIHQGIGDAAFCARQPQHYIISEGWYSLGLDSTPLPATLKPGKTLKVRQDCAPPAGGWRQAGRLRIQADKDLGDSQWTATLNGVALEATDDRSEPYENPYPQLLGEPGEHRAWQVPAGLLKDGVNDIEITLNQGLDTATLLFLDMALA
jgi:hypothetical protein